MVVEVKLITVTNDLINNVYYNEASIKTQTKGVGELLGYEQHICVLGGWYTPSSTITEAPMLGPFQTSPYVFFHLVVHLFSLIYLL